MIGLEFCNLAWLAWIDASSILLERIKCRVSVSSSVAGNLESIVHSCKMASASVDTLHYLEAVQDAFQFLRYGTLTPLVRWIIFSQRYVQLRYWIIRELFLFFFFSFNNFICAVSGSHLYKEEKKENGPNQQYRWLFPRRYRTSENTRWKKEKDKNKCSL